MIGTKSGAAAVFGLPNGLGQMIRMDLRGGSLSDHTAGGGQIFDQIMQVFDRTPSRGPRFAGLLSQNVHGAAVGVYFLLDRQVTSDALR